MSESDRSAFLAYLEKLFQGEVSGEAIFAALAEAASDPDVRYKWRVLEALERETKELLGRELVARGQTAVASEEARARGLKLGGKLARAPFDVFVANLRPEILKFVAEYEAGEATAPADGLALARHVTAHERAILDFTDLELAGRGSESVKPVLALLAAPPAREAM